MMKDKEFPGCQGSLAFILRISKIICEECGSQYKFRKPSGRTRNGSRKKNIQIICVEKKNQLDATEWFIALIICSTCFGHFYVHHQECSAPGMVTCHNYVLFPETLRWYRLGLFDNRKPISGVAKIYPV